MNQAEGHASIGGRLFKHAPRVRGSDHESCWTQTEKYTASARCRGGQRAWRNNKPVLSLSAVTDEEGHPLENEDELGRRLFEYW